MGPASSGKNCSISVNSAELNYSVHFPVCSHWCALSSIFTKRIPNKVQSGVLRKCLSAQVAANMLLLHGIESDEIYPSEKNL